MNQLENKFDALKEAHDYTRAIYYFTWAIVTLVSALLVSLVIFIVITGHANRAATRSAIERVEKQVKDLRKEIENKSITETK